MHAELNHMDLYRLPWTLPDNAISWLEPTSKCNLYCEGCYRQNNNDGHKPLEQVRKELEVFRRLRKSDSVSIAGGDPLTRPEIEKIVELIAKDGQKPIVNTNGQLLTKAKLQALKKAGVAGFTFHIDSGQYRPQWKGKNEIELNELRLKFARMLAESGGISCAFNATIYGHTLKFVPDIVEWGQLHIDIVHSLVFIAYRAAPLMKGFEYYAGAEKVDMTPIAYAIKENKEINIMSTDIVAVIRDKSPDFEPCAYLNGTEKPEHFKWLLTIRVGTRDRIYGYAGPKFMEVSQSFHHLRTGSYLAYTAPKILARAKSMLLLAPLDRGIWNVAKAYFGQIVRTPKAFLSRLHLQTIAIIQPADFMESGVLSMCDGCPDITIYDGRLVWSCRLEELTNFGDWVRAVPSKAAGKSSPTDI